jgi:L-lactate utilization protein LutB
MEKPIENYWNIKLDDVRDALENNNFEVYIVGTSAEAKKIVLNDILPKTGAKTVSWGGSVTFTSMGLYDELKDSGVYQAIDTFEKNIATEEILERRRQALLADLFITGANAITEDGLLINLDIIGNRVAALTFGPKSVIVLAGRNKIVPDIESAMIRIKQYTAPTNAMRLEMNTPCIKTGRCEECKSPKRICNTWTITEKSFPKGRVKIVLINEDLGL